MEIACNIVTIKNTKINNLKKIIEKININNLKVNDHTIFFKNIDKNAKNIKNNVNCLFNKVYGKENSKCMTDAFFYAYYIYNYKLDIFFYFASNLENRLIRYSKKVIYYFEKLKLNSSINNLNKFSNYLEDFKSVLTVWNSKDNIKKLKITKEEINEIINMYNINKSNNEKLKLYIKYIENILKKSINNNEGLTIKYMLDSYESIVIDEEISKKYWDIIENIYNKKKIWVSILAISILRYKLMNNSTNIKNKKILMYNIDIDLIIHKIRNKCEVDENISNCLNIIERYLGIQYNCNESFLNRIKKCFFFTKKLILNKIL